MSGSSSGPADPRELVVPTAAAMHDLGRRLARLLRAGDLIVLSGGLGAGKTTLTQGIGKGLGVSGAIISPTFVIARVHASLSGGPALVHVDAYRLGGIEELDDLDLDAELGDSVTVVEWGAGLAEVLAENRLELTLTRPVAGALPSRVPEPDALDEPRTVVLTAVGPRWAGADWSVLR